MLEAFDLSFRYRANGPDVFRDVSLTLMPGQIMGLSGPSGKGKSTLARLLGGHLALQQGKILHDGRAHRDGGFNPVQLLAQTPIFAVNPRWTIGRILHEVWAPDAETARALGVSTQWYERFPHELSGGELQRVTVLRALAPGVRYLIADEISAMLDPITQFEIWSFLIGYIREKQIGVLAISHDTRLLERIADTMISMD